MRFVWFANYKSRVKHELANFGRLVVMDFPDHLRGDGNLHGRR